MITIAEIKSNLTVIKDLDWPFDFTLRSADDDCDWIQLKPATPFTMIAGEGTGGVFLAYGKGETEYAEDHPDVPEARHRIVGALPIPILNDPIKVLHDNIHATDCVMVDVDGYEYESLFNKYKSSDNPNWR